jgi:hypothetical protein
VIANEKKESGELRARKTNKKCLIETDMNRKAKQNIMTKISSKYSRRSDKKNYEMYRLVNLNEIKVRK